MLIASLFHRHIDRVGDGDGWTLAGAVTHHTPQTHPFSRSLTQDIVETQLALGDLEGAEREIRRLAVLPRAEGALGTREAALRAEFEEIREKSGID